MPNNGLNNETTGYNLTYQIIDPDEVGSENSPAFVCRAHEEMRAQWQICSDVYAGTLRMRECGERYLPKYESESDARYRRRLSVATLMNAYARTVDAMVGLVIGSRITVNNLPEELETHKDNIDNAGTSLEVFARELLRDAFDGHAVILIDMPDPENPITDHAEALRAGLRPAWRRYKAEEITNWRTEEINGETVLTQIVFKECLTKPEGDFGEKHFVQYRRWFLKNSETTGERVAQWEIWEEVEEEKRDRIGRRMNGTKTVYVRTNRGETKLKRLPVVCVYGNKTGVLESIPPLIDLALKNIEHYQIDSDYKKGLSIAGIAIPVLNTKAETEDIKKKFGWEHIFALDLEEKFQFVEASGEALPNKVIALDNIKREMGVLGLSLIAERADSNITATERLLDSVQQSNQLQSIQASLLLGIRQAWYIHAEWMNASGQSIDVSETEVTLGLDWTELVRSADYMNVLLEFYKNQALSKETLIRSAIKYRVLTSDIDPIAEIERINKDLENSTQKLKMVADKHGLSIHSNGNLMSPPNMGLEEEQMRLGVEKANQDSKTLGSVSQLDKREKQA